MLAFPDRLDARDWALGKDREQGTRKGTGVAGIPWLLEVTVRWGQITWVANILRTQQEMRLSSCRRRPIFSSAVARAGRRLRSQIPRQATSSARTGTPRTGPDRFVDATVDPPGARTSIAGRAQSMRR